MVIFSHRGIGFGNKENSLISLTAAVKNGYSVEVDLRLLGDEIILSHDEKSRDEDLEEVEKLFQLAKDNPHAYFALHLKEDSEILYQKICNQVKELENCLIFVTDFKQDNFITSAFKAIGKERLALYAADESINPDLLNMVDYLWLDETKSNIYEDLSYFFKLNRKVICCSPELFNTEYQRRMELLRIEALKNKIFGICTDFPGYYFEKS